MPGYSEVLVLINPIWAEVIAREATDIGEVRQVLWRSSSLPSSDWPALYHEPIAELGRVRDGQVHLVQVSADVFDAVTRGLGSLHATVLHSWEATRTISRAIAPLGSGPGRSRGSEMSTPETSLSRIDSAPSLAARVEQQLEAAILAGELAPGTPAQRAGSRAPGATTWLITARNR